MSRSLLVRIAAVLALVTGMAHLAGTFMAVPVDQVAMHAAIATMKSTMVPMPVGPARSYMQILDGNNLCTALLLLVCAAQLFVLATAPGGRATDRQLLVTAIALAGFAMLSALYFFPVPTAMTALAALLTIIGRTRLPRGTMA